MKLFSFPDTPYFKCSSIVVLAILGVEPRAFLLSYIPTTVNFAKFLRLDLKLQSYCLRLPVLSLQECATLMSRKKNSITASSLVSTGPEKLECTLGTTHFLHVKMGNHCSYSKKTWSSKEILYLSTGQISCSSYS